jgi:hypothetical protein
MAVLQPVIQKSSGYLERAHSSRGTTQPVLICFCQIQQPLFRESIGIFSKPATPICLLFYK